MLYSAVVRYALIARQRNADQRGVVCGIPWKWREALELSSGWTRKNDHRQCNSTRVLATIFADDTTLHGLKEELHESDERGVAGMDAFAAAVAHWGSQEHEGKRERHTYGTPSNICLVGGGIAPGEAVNRNITRGLKCWAKIRPALKNTKLSHKSRGRLLMTFLYSPLAFSCKTRATRKRDVIRMQSVMDTASRYLCKTRLSQMKAQHINHSDLRALLQVPPLQAAMEREQMRWLGHISRMTPDTSTTHARTFARGAIDVGNFVRQASSDGGRISADRKSLPEVWVSLCHKHGFSEADVEQLASDRSAWNALLDQRVAQAIFEDRQLSHSYQNTLPDPGLQPWVRPAGGRARSPTAHEVRLQKQRDRRAAAKAAPKAAGLRRPAAARDPGAPAQPRQVRRHQDKKVYYAGYNQRRVTAAERETWEFVCDFPGCNLRFETSRALNIHKGKANKPGGAHTHLAFIGACMLLYHSCVLSRRTCLFRSCPALVFSHVCTIGP